MTSFTEPGTPRCASHLGSALTPSSRSVHYKLHPSNYPHAPPRTGPVMRFLFSLIPGSARRRRLAHEKRQREGAAPSRPRLATQGTLFIAMLYAQSREVSFGDQSLRSKRSRSAFGSVAGGRGGLEGLGEEGELTDEVMEMEEGERFFLSPLHSGSF